jgi:hypothetical protein
MEYRDIVNVIREKTSMKESAIRKAIQRLSERERAKSIPLTSRQAALLYACRKGIRIEKFAKPEEITHLQILLLSQGEIMPASKGRGSEKKKEEKGERTLFSPYDISLRAFQIDEELVRDCKMTKPYRAAIREATLTLETRIRKRLNLPDDVIGKDLIIEARKRGVFKRPVAAEEEGLFFLYCGTIAWLRNPPSHKKVEYGKDEAVKIILFIDYLLKLFDRLCQEACALSADQEKE